MSTIPLDYETLRLTWWFILGLVLLGFGLFGGRDLGVAIALPIVARKDDERRLLLNLVGPTWEGNQVWLVVGGAAIFAAWPQVYAVAFSALYPVMLLVLFALILRPVGFKFRSKVSNPLWRQIWDAVLFIGGLVPALVFGAAFGNLFLGIPFSLERTLRITYDGGFLNLLSPFALLCGTVSVAMIAAHGAALIAARIDDDAINRRARRLGIAAAMAAIALFAVAGCLLSSAVDGYRVTETIARDLPSNPLGKTVVVGQGLWLSNYALYPWTMLFPGLGFAGAMGAAISLWKKLNKTGFLSTSAAIAGIICTAGASLFPFLLPSSSAPSASLTAWDSSSSHQTLFIMLIVMVIFMPMILGYTTFLYRVMRGQVSRRNLKSNPNAY